MKLTKKAAKRFTLGEPVELPSPWPIKKSRKKLPPLVVTKVDRKLGTITLLSVVDAERCGTTASGLPIFALGRKP